MSRQAPPLAPFSITEARHLVKDLFEPIPAIYWADFLLSLCCGSIFFGLVREILPPWSLAQALAFVVCGLCYFRAALFTHELVHLRDKSFRNFRIAWNLLCGIPFLIPSFTYYTHVEHHTRRKFGTPDDGEYIPLVSKSPIHFMMYMCQPVVLPLLAVLRFAVITPITWFSPAMRDIVHRHASTMVMDPMYIRPLPSTKVLRMYRLQEVACFLWCLGVAWLLFRGRLPISYLITSYCLSVFILTLNNIRTLGAHRYTSGGQEQTFVEQLVDSVNYPHSVLAEMWGPVGLKFHALHHLFPSLPYHNLPEAHWRLMAALPADSPYRLTDGENLPTALVRLWRAARAHAQSQRRGHINPPHQPHVANNQAMRGASG